MMKYDITCSCIDEEIRLDAFIAQQDEPDISRTQAAELIKKGSVTLNGKKCKKSDTVKNGDKVSIELPEPETIELKPENIPLSIVYQDNDIAVINKARSMVVHPSVGHTSGTLVNALLYHLDDLSGINGELRPGIVHRLDMNTTGLLVVAKNDRAHRALAEQFKQRTCRKEYLALVEGNVKKDFQTIDKPLARSLHDRKKITVSSVGREAITDCEVLERFGTATLVKCYLHTGRTHQIRVHMAHIGNPCIGDNVYGYEKQRYKLDGQLLHSAFLEIIHPTSRETMSFVAEIPDDFAQVLKKLRNSIKN